MTLWFRALWKLVRDYEVPVITAALFANIVVREAKRTLHDERMLDAARGFRRIRPYTIDDAIEYAAWEWAGTFRGKIP